jgi:1-pyrroline-5-carboxylate dehydrogenase
MNITPFKNEPILDFTRDEHRKGIEAALRKVEASFGTEYPVVIGDQTFKTRDKIKSVNPAKPSEIIGVIHRADLKLIEKAFETAERAFKTWSRTPAEQRAEVLFKAAQLMRQRRYEIDATMILEVSKSWIEADADTAEAIDFLEYYGREMLRYAQGSPVVQNAGEKNACVFIPLGIGVVISPWNFPCAILTGMTSAALVTGNVVLMKPASTAPVIAARCFEILREAGAPAGTVNYVPCSGGDVGDALVDHVKTRFVSFTGSRDVGTRINERAARVQKGQKWLKRVVAEMGGKDAIVVDETADLEAAATGIVQAAYGFQGQKCSACSRAIVVDAVYDKVLELAKQKTGTLKVGDVRDPSVNVGAVIDENAYKKILKYINTGKKEGKIAAGGGAAKEAGEGYFIQPTIVADVKPGAAIEQEEIFGPVLAFIRAKDFDHALEIANDTDYGLTGAIYSKDPARLERARREFHVGNLYLNRKCTGALVGVHPFGGFNMSGTDSKAGGAEYLLLFMQAKSIAEKV